MILCKTKACGHACHMAEPLSPPNEQHYSFFFYNYLVGIYMLLMLGKGKCTPPTNVESFEMSISMCYDWSPYNHFELLSSLAENIPNAQSTTLSSIFSEKDC